ncbi:MAG TPA: c-type cytochrome [Casimicrobiaceae bacterium]|nr:c-type cytochrome [Casimicrobiaceae bacterium]
MRYALWLGANSLALAVSGPASAEAVAAKPDLAKAQQIVNQVCAACHGGDGNSTAPANPNLAGQQVEYITLQLQNFKSGVRSSAVMAGMVATLTPEDMRALGAYFAQQKPKPSAAKDRDLIQAGQKVYRGGNAASGLPACSACHAPTGVGIPSRYPRLSGQWPDYAYAQLKAFKAGERGNDKEGKDVNGRVMAQVASRMSDSEMQAVAQYISGLH